VSNSLDISYALDLFYQVTTRIPRPQTISNARSQCILQPDTSQIQRNTLHSSVAVMLFRGSTRAARQRFDNDVTSGPHLGVGRCV